MGRPLNDWQTQAGLQLAPARTGRFTAISELPATAARLDVGLDVFSRDGVEMKLTYNANLAAGYSAQTIVGRLTYHF